MKDRIPTPGQEGRMLITPENGTPYYATVAMADNPTQEGTPINGSTMLQDETAALFGLNTEAVPNDVFFKLTNALFNSNGTPTDINGNVIGLQIATGSYTGTGTGGSSNPNRLTFDFVPKFVFVLGSVASVGSTPCYGVILFPTISFGVTDERDDYEFGLTVTLSGNTVSWYSSSVTQPAMEQANLATTYHYVAIG